MNGQQPGPWRGAIAALCALLVGIGLARFAYTPLLPALVDGNWFSTSQAAYLGAANLAGYLAGAVLVLALNLLLGTKSLEPQNCFAQAVDFSHHFIAAIDPDGLNQATQGDELTRFQRPRLTSP